MSALERVCRISLIAACVATLANCNGENFGGFGDPSSGRIWGSSQAGLVNGSQSVARFSNPVNVEVASNGTVYVADFDNNAIRAIAPDGTVSTLVSQATVPVGVTFDHPFGLTIDLAGNLYVQTDTDDSGFRDATTGSTIWLVDRVTGDAEVVARRLGKQRGIQALADGRIAMADRVHQVISILDPVATIDPSIPSVTVLAGVADDAGSSDSSNPPARFNTPYGLALLADNSLLVADLGNHKIRRVLANGTVSTFAGTGTAGSGNGVAATATFNLPQDVTIAGTSVYVADNGNHLIRRISGGNVTTQAGNGTQGFVDADGTAAQFYALEGIDVSDDGSTLWISDGNNGDGSAFNRVRKLAVP